jgi:hypothetical protein
METPIVATTPEIAAQGQPNPLQSARRFARLLDDLVRVPGTRIGIGLDPLLNLIPIAGDAVGTAMSAYLLVTAVRMGVPKRVLARMLLNIAIDALVGAIPVLGQAFDFVWKANSMNMTLLERYATMPTSTTKSSGTMVVVVLMLFVLIVILVVWFAYLLLSLLASLLHLPLW